MSALSLPTMKRLARDGQPNEVSDERFNKLIESGLWDFVIDASDYKALLAKIFAVVFALWKTLTVGLYKSVDEVRTAFTAVGMRLGDYAADILGKVPLGVGGQASVEFGRIKVKDLGFTRNASWRDILTALKARGYKLCQPEDGVAIRIGYPDQPMNEIVWLAMEPVEDSSGNWSVLYVDRRDNGLWLSTRCNALGGVWRPGNELFFRK